MTWLLSLYRFKFKPHIITTLRLYIVGGGGCGCGGSGRKGRGRRRDAYNHDDDGFSWMIQWTIAFWRNSNESYPAFF